MYFGLFILTVSLFVGIFFMISSGDENWFAKILGLFMVIVACFGFGVIFSEKVYYPHSVESNKVIKQCELDLPRNQTCKLIAVPNEIERN